MSDSTVPSDASATEPGTDARLLMTGAGAPGASGILRSLECSTLDLGVVGVDMDPDAYGFALVDESYTVPAGTDDAYLERIRELVDREAIDVVLPLTTAELGPLSRAKAEFADHGVAVMVSDPDALETANDKGFLYAFLEERGFDAAPDFERVDSREAFVEAASHLGYPDRPVCFKRPVASGMRGFRVLDPTVDRADILLTEKPHSAVTTLEDVLVVLEEAESFPELVVMEYLPGPEYSVDVVSTGAEVPVVVPRSRERTRAGISFAGTVEENDELIAAAREITATLGLEYNANLQFRYDADGVPKLIEINPRVSGTIVMCTGAGANMPALGVKHALGLDPDPPEVAWGTSMRRFWQEVFEGPDGGRFRL